MSNKTQLLSTALLEQPLISKAAENGIVLDCVSFIEVNTINDPALTANVEELCSRKITAVFTSVNAVRAISRLIYIAKPDWNIYCVGDATKNALPHYFRGSAIKCIANDAASLAERIVKDKVSDVVFFCGDQRMDILPDILSQHGVHVKEMVVYETTETPHVISGDYDGILFFSPSALRSFFSTNKISDHTVLFAIGNTTAAAICAFANNIVVISETPSKENLVNQAIQYFNKKAPAAIADKT